MIQFITSEDPQYVFNGRFIYNGESDITNIDYLNIDLIDPDCIECGILATIHASDFYVPDKYKQFRILEYKENTILQAEMISTGAILDFSSRATFGPFDGFSN